MTRRLQSFDFRRSPYERPMDRWVCGRASSGQPCRLGPNRLGLCQTRTGCDPINSQGTWTCVRSEGEGGKCADGPRADGSCCLTVPRCVPVRNLRSLRGRIAFWSFAFTLAALVFVLGSDGSPTFIHPGPVIQGHAEVAGCAKCHASFDGPVTKWLLAAFKPSDLAADTKKCLSCHDKGKDPLRPHSLSHAILVKHSEAAARPSGDAKGPLAHRMSEVLFPGGGDANGLLGCASCHKEHLGAQFDPTLVSDNRCQSCHKYRFRSFAEGHPPFGDYPYPRRTRLAFDHHKHFERNFAQAKVRNPPTTCADCHQPNRNGRFMVVASFDKTCGTCHAGDIEGKGLVGAKGVPVFGLPGLDARTLRRRGFGVGQWPKDAQGDEVSPFIKFILAGNPQLDADFRTIAETDLQDLTKADRTVLSAVQRVGWAIKELIHDLAQSGAGAVRARLDARMRSEINRESLGRMLGNIPQDVVRSAQKLWFPRLEKEIAAHRKKRAAIGIPQPPTRWTMHQVFPAEPTTRIRLAAAGSGGQTFAQLARAQGPPVQVAQAGGDILSGNVRQIERRSLRLDDYRKLLKEDRAAKDKLFTKDRSSGKLPDISKIGGARRTPQSPKTVSRGVRRPQIAQDPNLASERWAGTGGWFRRDYALYYRPVEHRDPFMRSWLDISAGAYGTSSQPYGEALLDVFRAKDTVGKCVRCHSVDRVADGSRKINWKPFSPDLDAQRFTVFNHSTHFSIVGENGCRTCHKVNPKAQFASAFKGFDPAKFQSSFGPIDRKTCAQCHVPESAGDSCILCHRYHVGETAMPSVFTEIAATSGGATRLSGASSPPTTPSPEPSPSPSRTQAPAAAKTKPPAPAAKPVQKVKPTQRVAARAAPDRVQNRVRGDGSVGEFAIRLASFKTESRADRSKTRLQRLLADTLDGQVLLVEPLRLRRGRTIYRVVARPYASRGAADRICRRIAKKRKIRCAVIR